MKHSKGSTANKLGIYKSIRAYNRAINRVMNYGNYDSKAAGSRK